MGQLTNLLTAPMGAARVFSGAKSFALPIIGNENLNRRGLHVWRTQLAHRMAERRRRRLEALVSPKDREDFARDGYVMKRDLLPPGIHADLVKQIMEMSVPAREMREGQAITRRIPVTHEVLCQAPALRHLLESSEWKGLTRYVASFDEEPMVSIQVIFGKAGEDPQTSLHMDTFHPTMKAWFFLHEVADDEGPLTYVAGSHRMSRRRLAWQKRQSVLSSQKSGRKGGAFRLMPAELPHLRWPQPTRFAVPGNTLVVADTCGFHARAHSPKDTVRIEVYATCRPNPFKPTTQLGLDRLPFLGRRRVEAYFWLQDRLAPLGIVPATWRDIGRTPTAQPSTAWDER